MKPEYLYQLTKWFDEEREGIKAKGARSKILEESAFLELVLDAVKQAGPGGVNLTFKKLIESSQRMPGRTWSESTAATVGPKKILSQPIAVWGIPNQTRGRKRTV
jgi:hypothetical protein